MFETKIIMNKLYYCLIVLIILISSCKKDENITLSDREKMLVAHSWKYNILGIDNDRNNQLDLNLNFLELFPCRKDDVLTFYENKTMKAVDGANVCQASDPQIAIGNWSFIHNDSILQVGTASYNIIYFQSDSALSWIMNGTDRLLVGIKMK